MSLVETKTEGLTVVRCKHCNTILAEIQDIRKAMNDCQHFRWEQVRTVCFHEYFEYPECDADYLFILRRKYLVRLNCGKSQFLLVPK